ncbi:MAG: MGDG synthase family glycosyltransferase [Acidimicrobiales bacterium]
MGGRVLVISASMGEGHDGAARELVRRLQARGHEARMVDFLDAPPMGIGPLTRSSYEVQLRRAPWSYEATYRIWTILPFLCRPLAAFVSFLAGRQHLRWIAEFEPDVVVTTYPLASLVLGRLRRRGRIHVPTVTFVTDFAVHPLWVHPGVDLTLCVHSNPAAVATRRTGRPARAPGPMVADAFRAEPPDRQRARAELGLDPDDKAVLVVAGSWGVGEIDRTFDTLAASGRYTPIAMCGRNEDLRASLAARPGGQALGWTDQMPALMAASDAIVQNAGGLTCMESFAVGLPVVTYLPIPGHGRENGDEMERAGVAAYARSPEDLLPALDRVTTLAGRAQVAAGKAMFSGDAAEDVAQLARPAPDVAVAPVPRWSPRRQRIAAVAISLVAIWSAFTVGVEAAAAHGIGVARPEHHAQEVYVGVRLGPAALADPTLASHLAGAGATAIVDGTLAAAEPAAVRRLSDAGVDVANGGWGHANRRPWSRARADLLRSCHSIRSANGQPCRVFVPGRRVDGFDLASARLAHQRIIATPTRLAPDDVPGHLLSGRIYVLDARFLDAATVARTLDDLRPALAAGHLGVAAFADLR